MASISGSDLYIDGRDVMSAVDELSFDISMKEDEVQTKTDEINNLDDYEDAADIAELKDEKAELEIEIRDLNEELEPLQGLWDDIENYGGCNTTLINEDEFEEYAMRFAVDCGEISEDASLFSYVDWERYADNLKIDYTSISFDGGDFLARS